MSEVTFSEVQFVSIEEMTLNFPRQAILAVLSEPETFPFYGVSPAGVKFALLLEGEDEVIALEYFVSRVVPEGNCWTLLVEGNRAFDTNQRELPVFKGRYKMLAIKGERK